MKKKIAVPGIVVMKYITKLTCGQVIARLWMDLYSPFDYCTNVT